MKLHCNKWLRSLLLGGVYTMGVFGILASSGDGDSGSTSFTCGLSIRGLAPVGDGTVWAGVFAKTNTRTEDRVVLLGDDGAEQLSYFIGDGGSENAVRVVALAGGISDVYVGGDFPGGILRLNSNGSLDTDFDVGTGFDGRVTSIVPVNNTGEVYVGGFFDNYNGTTVTGFVRLLEDGTLDTFGGILPAAVGAAVDDVESIAMAGTLVTDDVYSGNGILPLIKRWNGNGLEVNVYNDPKLGAGSVLNITPASLSGPNAGDIYLGGTFANGIVRLQGDGQKDNLFFVTDGFDADVAGVALATALPEAIYVGGAFTTYENVSANGLIRLNDDGSRDLVFDVGDGFSDPNNVFPFSKVSSVVEDVSLDVFVGGGFTRYDGSVVNGIVRLDTDGSLDTAFDVSINIDGEVCDSQTIPGS